MSAPNKSTVGADTVVEPYSNGGGCPDAAVTHPDVAVDTERAGEQVPQSQEDRVRWGDFIGVREIRREVVKVYHQITTT